jgi:hypothetical protein
MSPRKTPLQQAAAILGRKGGSVSTPKKAAASRRNGLKAASKRPRWTPQNT